LRQLDARTLAPLRGGWSRTVDPRAAVAVSPSGSRVVIARGRLLVLDTATGRVVRMFGAFHDYERLYWLGGDGTPGSPELLVGKLGFGCWSHGCGHEFRLFTPAQGWQGDDGFYDGDATTAALRSGLVIEFDTAPKELLVYGTRFADAYDTSIKLPRIPPSVPFSVVADVVHDRVFAISSAGLVGQINNPDRRRRIRYHSVDLNGRPFDAAWAGDGRIALWGEDGLGTIDTRTWTTHAIAADVRHAIATPFGIAAWTDNPADGLTVYRPDGRQRLRLLVGKQVKAARAVGDYLYADTVDAARYSINLRTGKVVGPLSTDATILVPDLVAIA
jgi:hypothetical protein